jgi:hypothetical protein
MAKVVKLVGGRKLQIKHGGGGGVFAGIGHKRLHEITSPLDHLSAAIPGRMLKADANGMPVNATNTDAQVAAAVTASHARQHALNSALDHSVPTGPVDMNGQLINNVADPVDSQDAATKEYVDSIVAFTAYFFATNDASGIGAGYYKLFDYDPAAAVSLLTVTPAAADQKLFTYITEANHPNMTELAHGVYTVHLHANVTAIAGKKTARLYAKIGERTGGGLETVRVTTEFGDVLAVAYSEMELHAVLGSDIAINATDRLFVEVWAQSSGVVAAYPEINVQQEGTTVSGLVMPSTQAYIDANYVRRDGTLPMLGDLDMDATYTVKDLKAPANAGDALRRTATITEAGLQRLLSDYDPIGCVIGDGVNVIAAGSKLFRTITHDCTVVAWTIVGDPAGSIVVDVKNGTYAAHPVKASIAGTELPTLTAQDKNTDVALGTWTPALLAGDVLEFTWGAATTCKRVTVTLFVTRT